MCNKKCYIMEYKNIACLKERVATQVVNLIDYDISPPVALKQMGKVCGVPPDALLQNCYTLIHIIIKMEDNKLLIKKI